MRAEARVVAEANGTGRTRLAVLRGESPLLLRQTGPRHGGGSGGDSGRSGSISTGGASGSGGGPGRGGVTVHLVGGAAGPLRGDELRLEIEVGPGAWLEFRSVAASLALRGRSFLPASRLTVTASVAAGGTLRYLPEPLIAAAGCDHVTITEVDVAEGGSLIWRDDLVCGRHGEESGDVRADMTVRYAGTTIYRHELSVGPAAPGWAGPAVLGGGRAVGTIVTAGPGSNTPPAGTSGSRQVADASGKPQAADTSGSPQAVDASGRPQPVDASGKPQAANATGSVADVAVMPLAQGGTLVSVVGADVRQVSAALDPWCETYPSATPATPARSAA
jgi:urease accessory protein